MSNKWTAHLQLLFANVVWGLMSPISKSVLISGEVSPLALSGIRIFGGTLLYIIFSFILPPSMNTRQKIDKKDWFKIFMCSLLIISANQGLYIIGIGFTNPVDSSVMCSLTPIITLILSAILLKNPITWMKGLGVLVGLAGTIILVTDSQESSIASNPLLGNTMCFVAQFCAAVYFVKFVDLINRYSPFTLMKWMFIMSSLTFVPFCAPDMLKVDFASLSIDIYLELGYIILFATFFSFLAMLSAQRIIKPTVVTMYNYFQPVCAALASVALGVGDFGPVKAMATALIFVGVYLVIRTTSTPRTAIR